MAALAGLVIGCPRGRAWNRSSTRLLQKPSPAESHQGRSKRDDFVTVCVLASAVLPALFFCSANSRAVTWAKKSNLLSTVAIGVTPGVILLILQSFSGIGLLALYFGICISVFSGPIVWESSHGFTDQASDLTSDSEDLRLLL